MASPSQKQLVKLCFPHSLLGLWVQQGCVWMCTFHWIIVLITGQLGTYSSFQVIHVCLGKLGVWSNFTMNKSRGLVTECHWFLLNSFYKSKGDEIFEYCKTAYHSQTVTWSFSKISRFQIDAIPVNRVVCCFGISYLDH